MSSSHAGLKTRELSNLPVPHAGVESIALCAIDADSTLISSLRTKKEYGARQKKGGLWAENDEMTLIDGPLQASRRGGCAAPPGLASGDSSCSMFNTRRNASLI